MSAQKSKIVKKSNLKDLLSELDTNLSQEERLLALNWLNKSLNTFPLEDVIKYRQDGALLANGKALSIEQMVSFRESLTALKSNFAFQIIADQILFLAISEGIHKGLNTDMIMFSKSAIWFIQKFKEVLDKLDVLK
tara:strand:+ start:9048 stop:9455 length:408 start_codon:yes stop_codon:yes gene_type:complete